jgi:hypothetical protein
MHTENLASIDLIRAAVVAQLAKPAVSVSQFSQITDLFKYQVLTWIGIIGSAITLFANLTGVLDLADWARELTAHWHNWTQMFWAWVFNLIGMRVPKYLAPVISFIVFTIMLLIGVNLLARRLTTSGTLQRTLTMKRIWILIAGVFTVFVGLFAVVVIMGFAVYVTTGFNWIGIALVVGAVWLWALGFPVGYLMWLVKERSWVFLNSLLFLVMVECLLYVPLREPLRDMPQEEWRGECCALELPDGGNFVQSGEAVDATVELRGVRSAHAHRVERDFQTEFASISETDKRIGNIFANAFIASHAAA